MLSDRPYMRVGDAVPARRLLPILLGSLAALFLVEAVLRSWFQWGGLREALALTGMSLQHLGAWKLVTYAMLHGDLFHLLINLLGLWIFGRQVEEEMGPRRLAELLVLGVVGGGLFFALVNLGRPVPVVGISAGVLALLAHWSRRRWFDRAMLFPFPIELPIRWIFFGVLGLNVFGLLIEELPSSSGGGTASSAHLGGLAVGWLWARWRSGQPVTAPRMELPAWAAKARRSRKASSEQDQPTYRVDLSSRTALRAEIDRILDKINAEGFGSLSPEEKATLDRGRSELGKG